MSKEKATKAAPSTFTLNAGEALHERGRRLPLTGGDTGGGFWEEFLGRPLTEKEARRLKATQDQNNR
jgi:hypothetical protein